MSRRLTAFLTVLALSIVSCGPSAIKDESRSQSAAPALSMVLVVKEVRGEILNSPLDKPTGLAVDFRGDIYVTDAGNNRLLKFKADLTPNSETGGYGGEAGLLNRPTYMAFDNGLNLMVSDEGNRRICRYNSTLNFVDEILFFDDEDPLKFGYPSGIAFTSYGEIWVADRDKQQIAVFNNVGSFDRFLGEEGYAGEKLASPEKIVRDRQGNFIVCDAGNGRLVYFDSYGNLVRETRRFELGYPVSAVVLDGLTWVLDKTDGMILALDGRDRVVYEAGPNLPGSETPLKQPTDMIALPDGDLLIADSGNNRLVVCRIVLADE